MATSVRIGTVSLSTSDVKDAIRQLIPNVREIILDFHTIAPEELYSFTKSYEWDAVILVHPITEGRLSLTDVEDARYKRLLPALKEQFGSRRVCVIVHSMSELNENTQKSHLAALHVTQPTVFKESGVVVLCSELEKMFQEDKECLKKFVNETWKETTGSNVPKEVEDGWKEIINPEAPKQNKTTRGRKEAKSPITQQPKTTGGRKDARSPNTKQPKDDGKATQTSTISNYCCCCHCLVWCCSNICECCCNCCQWCCNCCQWPCNCCQCCPASCQKTQSYQEL